MTTFLIYIVIILTIVAVAQLVRVFELASELKGSKQNDVTDSDNRAQAKMWIYFMIAFFAFCAWQFFKYKDKLLPVAASAEGAQTDWLFNFNMLVIGIVFIATNILLFVFANKYHGKKGNTATYYPHNNKLELMWTIVPAVVLFIIIFLGLKTWNTIMTPAKPESLVIELYAKQFDWTARYAGKDNQLGTSNYKLITGVNALGLDSSDTKNNDDIIVRNEFHVPVGQDISFMFRSRDVIHSAFFPHFRAQMNCVPGMTTMYHFTPTMTTAQMREETKNDKFDYVLLCNKICGASHYNMQMTIIVESPEEYKKWIATQKPFFGSKATANVEKEETKILVQK